MLLPNYELAIIDLEKLIDYCLNPYHFTGKHKARVFKSALDIDAENYYILDNAIKNAIALYEAIITKETQYGTHYIVDFPMVNNGKKGIIRTAWIIKNDEHNPRLTTCFVLL